MNAPYDGDRGQGAAGSGYPESPPEPGQVPPQHDMYLQDAYDQDPYRAQDLAAQDPVTEALYDRAAHPPPPPGTYEQQQPLYAPPPQSPHAPDPRVWAQTPAPEPDRAAPYLPYGDDPRKTQFVGVDDLVTHSGEEYHEPDAFAHLFRDQQQGGGPAPMDPPAAPGPVSGPGPGQGPVNPYPAAPYAQGPQQPNGYADASYQPGPSVPGGPVPSSVPSPAGAPEPAGTA
ncbi:murein biosynthesis integral membrane protein MurJ, partial [Streptomyces sp. ATE26]|nr:murein biosynthesis integral membrane protein MurJ [Streptomyces sp. ATE26]